MNGASPPSAWSMRSRPITGVWQPTRYDVPSASMRSTVAPNFASSVSVIHGATYWLNVIIPSNQKSASMSATLRTGVIIGAAKLSDAQ